MNWRFTLLFILVFSVITRAGDSTLILKKVINGGLSPKSVVHSGQGLFFAQNMMYRHTISVYDRKYNLVKTINDNIQPKSFGIDSIAGTLSGSPVEAAFSHNGKYAWVSNYNMSGDKFSNPGCDGCLANTYDPSYLYKINTSTLKIESIIQVGSVPKYVAVSPNDKYVLVSNWSSGDVSIVSVEKNKEIKRIKAGRFPRGIVVDSKSKNAYVTIMGSTHILKINLEDFSTSWIKNVGSGPRHLCISSNDSTLYVSLNNEGNIAKINLSDNSMEKTSCGGSPRSMIISPDDKFLYVVNYSINKMSKVDLKSFKVVEQHETKEHPIGITFDEEENEVWVACYSGSLMVYKDTYYKKTANWYDAFDVSNQVGFVYDFIGSVSDNVIVPTGMAMTNGNQKSVSKKDSDENHPEQREGTNDKGQMTNVVGRRESTNDKVQMTNKVERTNGTKDKGQITNNIGRGHPERSEGTKSKEKQFSYPTGTMFVIVGSFKVEDNAKRLYQTMLSKGYSATTFKNKNGFTYTALGGFDNEEKANETLQKIKSQEGIDAWIYRL